ncbi:putative fatty acyl-CoA reductase CG5065 [Rhynchophorus ferrugineus]|uniref:putative fatty acyl-CoA reductase CG5065 n=1 Tax=Rhynchophorus ferrugineus TaxID=354439 RepID=UPI003FCEBACA
MLSYYATKEWKFENSNVKTLWKEMRKSDRELFDFDICALNWDMYFYTCIRGTSGLKL